MFLAALICANDGAVVKIDTVVYSCEGFKYDIDFQPHALENSRSFNGIVFHNTVWVLNLKLSSL